MLLIVAIAILSLTVLAGGWLGAQVLLLELPPPAGVSWRGLAHGAAGMVGFAVLVAALRYDAPTPRALRMGSGQFGNFAGALVAGAVLAGLTMLLLQLRRRPIPIGLVAAHGLLGITGYTLVVTYLTMLY